MSERRNTINASSVDASSTLQIEASENLQVWNLEPVTGTAGVPACW